MLGVCKWKNEDDPIQKNISFIPKLRLYIAYTMS